MKKSLFIITGASTGIGKGLAEKALQQANHHVVGVSRTHSIKHANYKAITWDLSNVAELAKEAPSLLDNISSYDRIVLINNAGTLGDVKHMGAIEPSSIAHLFNLNVTAPIILMNTFMKELKTFSGEKVIINISSGAGKRPVDGWSGYCASKAALDMATKVAYEENNLDGQHFQIRAIAPGVVDTNMQAQIRESDPNSFSGVEKFKQLKSEHELSSQEAVAEKYFHILDHLTQYPDPILDVRNI